MLNVSTAQYEFSHGRRPRGTGLWYFQVRYLDRHEDEFQFTGTYTDAVKALRQTVKVAPYPAVQAQVLP